MPRSWVSLMGGSLRGGRPGRGRRRLRPNRGRPPPRGSAAFGRYHLQALERRPGACHRAGGKPERPGERAPLRPATTRAALVLDPQATEQDPGLGHQPTDGGVGLDRGHRVALAGHARRGSRCALGDLGNLGLGQEDHVERDLAGGAPADSQSGPQLRSACGRRARESAGRAGRAGGPARPAGRPLFAQRVERARGPPELDGQAVAPEVREPIGGGVDGHQPTGGLQAEGDRRRLLQERAAGHHGVAVTPGQVGAGESEAGKIGEHQVEGRARDQHRGGVEDVLAGGGVVNVLPRRCREMRSERRQHGEDRRRRCSRVTTELLDVITIGRADVRDQSRGFGWDHTDGGLSRGQLGLETQHGGQPGGVRGGVHHRRGREAGPEEPARRGH